MKGSFNIDGVIKHFRKTMHAAGIKMTDDRKDTPLRYAKFLRDFTEKEFPKMTFFDLKGEPEMLIERNLRVASLCEHHMLPFVGQAYVAYIPSAKKKILGLSKLGRLVSFFASDFTTQETLTNQIADSLFEMDQLAPAGVGVAIECWHSCMAIRGIREQSATTRTTALRGVIHTNECSRREFLQVAQSLRAF